MKIRSLLNCTISILALQAVLAGPVSAAAPATEAPVVVKPMDPSANAVELPLRLDQVMTTFVTDLTGHVQALDANQTNVAVCFDTYEKAAGQPEAMRIAAYHECLATTAAETQATWTATAATFRTFATNLSGLVKQADEIKRYVGQQEQQVTERLRVLQTDITESRSKLQRVQATLARGQTLTAEQSRQVRRLIDDVMTAHAKAQQLTQQRTFFGQTGQYLGTYVGQIGDLRGEVDLLDHQSVNRASVWAASLDNIRMRATISVMDANFAQLRQSLEKVGPMIIKIRGGLESAPPVLPGAAETPVDQLQLPNENLVDVLAAVLDRTK